MYGGLIASLVDCHCCNLAVAYAYREEARLIGSEPKVSDYKPPGTQRLPEFFETNGTPIDQKISLSGRVLNVENRKIWIDCEVISKRKRSAR